MFILIESSLRGAQFILKDCLEVDEVISDK